MKPLTKLTAWVHFPKRGAYRDVYLAEVADARIAELEAEVVEWRGQRDQWAGLCVTMERRIKQLDEEAQDYSDRLEKGEFLDQAKNDRIHRLQAKCEELEAENNRAWTAANRAEARVQAWEATVVCVGLPMRMHATREQWGPRANEPVEVPHVTPEKLTDILDRLAALEAERDAARAAMIRLHDVVVRQNRLGATWQPDVFGDLMAAMQACGSVRDAIDAARGRE